MKTEMQSIPPSSTPHQTLTPPSLFSHCRPLQPVSPQPGLTFQSQSLKDLVSLQPACNCTLAENCHKNYVFFFFLNFLMAPKNTMLQYPDTIITISLIHEDLKNFFVSRNKDYVIGINGKETAVLQCFSSLLTTQNCF